jgi:hypothetical protein
MQEFLPDDFTSIPQDFLKVHHILAYTFTKTVQLIYFRQQEQNFIAEI